VVTDNGNFIIDAPFERGHMLILSWQVIYLHKRWLLILSGKIMAQIKMLTGVVEVGLFCKMARAAYFGNSVSKFEGFD
jgi:ribose 5-phosphate isomerase A